MATSCNECGNVCTGCTTTCYSTCYSGCGNYCDWQCASRNSCLCVACTGCTGSCIGDCDRYCGSTCEKDCQYICSGQCEYICSSSCNANCDLTCSTGCTTGCGSTCNRGCDLTCTSTCTGGCKSTCVYGNVSGTLPINHNTSNNTNNAGKVLVQRTRGSTVSTLTGTDISSTQQSGDILTFSVGGNYTSSYSSVYKVRCTTSSGGVTVKTRKKRVNK